MRRGSNINIPRDHIYLKSGDPLGGLKHIINEMRSRPDVAVYRLIKDKEEVILSDYLDRYEEPNKYYGKLTKIGSHIVNTFLKHKEPLGAMFVGESGAGKTELAKFICNRLLEAGYPVIEISDINVTIKDLNFIFELDKVVIFIDEFSKIVNPNIQNKMLSKLSGIDGKRRMVILTENTSNMINPFILNRPGRIKYHLEFSKLPHDVFTEYISEFDLDKKFIKDLNRIYIKASKFSFDHLRAIIEEKINYPEMDLDEIIEILNVKNVKVNKTINLLSIKTIKSSKKVNIDSISGRILNLSGIKNPLKMFLSGTLNMYINLDIKIDDVSHTVVTDISSSNMVEYLDTIKVSKTVKVNIQSSPGQSNEVKQDNNELSFNNIVPNTNQVELELELIMNYDYPNEYIGG